MLYDLREIKDFSKFQRHKDEIFATSYIKVLVTIFKCIKSFLLKTKTSTYRLLFL